MSVLDLEVGRGILKSKEEIDKSGCNLRSIQD